MLFTSFIAWPSPTRLPQRKTLGLMTLSTGSAFS
jgi:hypothetical protein